MKSAVRALLSALVCLLPITSFASVNAFLLEAGPVPIVEPAALALLGIALVLTARALRVKVDDEI
jgi:hypothetical protein